MTDKNLECFSKDIRALNVKCGIIGRPIFVQAKLKAAKLVEEAERTAMEAAQRAARESVETETVSIREAAASEDARKKSTDDDDTNTKDTTSLSKMPKQPLLTDGNLFL